MNLCQYCKKDFPECDGEPFFASDCGGDKHDDSVIRCATYDWTDEARW